MQSEEHCPSTAADCPSIADQGSPEQPRGQLEEGIISWLQGTENHDGTSANIVSGRLFSAAQFPNLIIESPPTTQGCRLVCESRTVLEAHSSMMVFVSFGPITADADSSVTLRLG